MSLGKQEDQDGEKPSQAGRDRREAATSECAGIAGQSVADAVRATEVTYYRWRGGLKSDQSAS
jgi:hypothetical protein